MGDPTVDPATPFSTAPPASALQETGARGFDTGLASAREAWVRAGHDAGAFDAAAKADGFNPVNPVAADVVKAHSDFGLPVAPAPEDYRVNFGAYAESRPPDRVAATNAELTGWAAAIGFAPSMGSAVIEQLVDLGQRHQAMTPEVIERWGNEQDALALRLAGGSEKAVAEMKDRALTALGFAKGSKTSEDLRNSVAMRDAVFVSTLANHAAMREAFDKAHPGLWEKHGARAA